MLQIFSTSLFLALKKSPQCPVAYIHRAERQRARGCCWKWNGMESILSPPCAANKHPKPRRAPQTKTTATATAHAFPCLLLYSYEGCKSNETDEAATPPTLRPTDAWDHHARTPPHLTRVHPSRGCAAPGFRRREERTGFARNGPVITRKSRAHPSAPPRYKTTGGASSANSQNQLKPKPTHVKAENLRKTPGNRIKFSPHCPLLCCNPTRPPLPPHPP